MCVDLCCIDTVLFLFSGMYVFSYLSVKLKVYNSVANDLNIKKEYKKVRPIPTCFDYYCKNPPINFEKHWLIQFSNHSTCAYDVQKWGDF